MPMTLAWCTTLAGNTQYLLAANAGTFKNHRKSLIFGAGCRIRTRDPLITNQVLYQLS